MVHCHLSLEKGSISTPQDSRIDYPGPGYYPVKGTVALKKPYQKGRTWSGVRQAEKSQAPRPVKEEELIDSNFQLVTIFNWSRISPTEPYCEAVTAPASWALETGQHCNSAPTRLFESVYFRVHFIANLARIAEMERRRQKSFLSQVGQR